MKALSACESGVSLSPDPRRWPRSPSPRAPEPQAVLPGGRCSRSGKSRARPHAIWAACALLLSRRHGALDGQLQLLGACTGGHREDSAGLQTPRPREGLDMAKGGRVEGGLGDTQTWLETQHYLSPAGWPRDNCSSFPEKPLGGHARPCGVVGRLSWTVRAIPCAITAHGAWRAHPCYIRTGCGDAVYMVREAVPELGAPVGDRQLGTPRPGLTAGEAAVSPSPAPVEWEWGSWARGKPTPWGMRGWRG